MLKLTQVFIKGFWGNRSVNMNMNNDISFIVGNNGSGKTTFINLISAALTLNIMELRKTFFDELEISFVREEDGSCPSVKFVKTENALKLFEKNDISVEYPKAHVRMWSDRTLRAYNEVTYLQRELLNEPLSLKEEKNTVLNDVRISWLSVHRESLENRRSNQERYPTIDIRLLGLCNNLVRLFSRYASFANDELSTFQEQFFLLLMENETSSSFSFPFIITDSEDLKKEKEVVVEILKELHVSSQRISDTVDAFYDKLLPKSIKAFQTLEEHLPNAPKKTKPQTPKPSFGMLELGAMISSAKLRVAAKHWNRYLEKKNQILSLQNKFIDLLNSMFDGPNGKSVYVNQSNELCIKTQSGINLNLQQLSSGEKQMIILLGEALLQDNSPYIYIADEPELSLHVKWQSMLVKSILDINPRAQLIFATHSPDIVSEFSDKVKYMEDALR